MPRTNIVSKLEKWLKTQGYKMVSAKEFALINEMSVEGVYKRINTGKINYIQVDGTKILLIKTK